MLNIPIEESRTDEISFESRSTHLFMITYCEHSTEIKRLQIFPAPQQAIIREFPMTQLPPSQNQLFKRDTYILSLPRKRTNVSNPVID